MFNSLPSLIGIKLARFYQKLFGIGTQPIDGYFSKDVAIYCILNRHILTPNLVARFLSGLF
jgi:hypothetical protein